MGKTHLLKPCGAWENRNALNLPQSPAIETLFQPQSQTIHAMKVENVRRANDDELPDHWRNGRRANPVVLEMDDGAVIIAAQDPELNGPGHLLGFDKETGDYFDFEVP